ncbi:MAG: CTP synthase [Patescibacteria group bacterium]
MKLIFISGGVISGIGKGITAASLGLLLEKQGYKVSFLKCDPYINIDAGTMNPIEHGEVFVTDDGYEMDMDGGHYERFMGINVSRINAITTGQIYSKVIQNERNLKYDGACVEVIPHIRDEIVSRIEEAYNHDEILIIEIGGTIGEYQNDIYYEAERYLKRKLKDDLLHIHISYLPVPKSIGEMKTKPTQQSVMHLNQRGIFPDIIVGRSDSPIDKLRRKKIAVATNVEEDCVFSNTDVSSIYKVPYNFYLQKLDIKVLDFLNLKSKDINMEDWKALISSIDTNYKKNITIGMVGKYHTSGSFSLEDAYVSVVESIKIACWSEKINFKIKWLDSENINMNVLKTCNGIIVPGGFGERGIEGKIKAIRYARENNIPYFGLCYGMQLAAVEFARNVIGLKKANSEEVNPKTPDPIIHIMPDQEKKLLAKDYGGSMRLGAWECVLSKDSVAYKAYKKEKISERHRHRYEFNNKYRKIFEKLGIVFSGLSPDSKLVEIMELKNHPFFVGVQFHPEFKSKPLSPHPLFVEFISNCIKNKGGEYQDGAL